MDSTRPVLVVGGGLSGLACAVRLRELGVASELFEAADAVGGRVRTDLVEGFALDRGFQVLLTAYPEAQRMLDLDGLELGFFGPGALVWREGRLRALVDPFRRPGRALETLRSGIATLGDALRVARLRRRVSAGDADQRLRSSRRSALELLRDEGFSEAIIESFFRPFFGGVFLDRDLASADAALEYLFRMFAEGAAGLPAGGMEAIPRQLVSRLPGASVHTDARVASIDPARSVVGLADGRTHQGSAIVIATQADVAARFCSDVAPVAMRATKCIEFDAEQPPPIGDLLALDGEGTGPINEVAVPSAVASGYAPAGRSLVSATALSPWAARDDDELVAAARTQLGAWFGARVEDWRVLRVAHVERALPHQTPGGSAPAPRSPRLAERLFVCGDHCDLASIQGALASGRRAADAVAADLALPAREASGRH